MTYSFLCNLYQPCMTGIFHPPLQNTQKYFLCFELTSTIPSKSCKARVRVFVLGLFILFPFLFFLFFSFIIFHLIFLFLILFYLILFHFISIYLFIYLFNMSKVLTYFHTRVQLGISTVLEILQSFSLQVGPRSGSIIEV